MYDAEIVKVSSTDEAAKEIAAIGVSEDCIRIMKDKAVFCVVRLHGLRNAVATILKQEMLSIGADATVSQWTVDCSRPKTDVLLMGTIKHYKHLIVKMRQQGAARPTVEKKDEYKAVAEELSAILKKDLQP
ncbi:MAG: hypothetical protein NTV88_04090 [Candidatus Micrarchaeota archaeon]|nr:hypothetical protein [Candidatus Micrarchaeota archaeon]